MLTCQFFKLVKCWNDRWRSPLQKKHDHHGQGEVCDPGARSTVGEPMDTGPAPDGEHQRSHTGIEAAIDVQEL